MGSPSVLNPESLSQEEYDQRVRESRKYLCITTANIFFIVTGICMVLYSYVDDIEEDLHYIILHYGEVGRAHLYLRNQGGFLLCITAGSIIAFVYPSLINYYIYITLVISLMVVHMNTAYVIYGDDRVGSIYLKIKIYKMSNLSELTGNDFSSFIRLQTKFKCCNTTAGELWPEENPPDKMAQCCPPQFVNTETLRCPYELSFLEPCDNVILNYTRNRVWKYFFIFCSATFVEFGSLTSLVPAMFQAHIHKKGKRKKSSEKIS